MPDSWDDTAERWLSGDLDAEQTRAFLLATKADVERLRRLGRLLRQQAMIAEQLGAARVQLAPRRHVRHVLHILRWGTAVAALVLVALWLGLPVRQPLAQVVAFSAGEAQVVDQHGVSRALTLTAPQLYAGDSVVTGAAQVRVQLSGEDTVIACAPATRLELRGDGVARLVVRQGRIDASVAPQPVGRPLIISTPTALVTVVGTQLSVVADERATVVAVTSGRVQVAGRATPTQATALSAGHFARVVEPEAITAAVTSAVPVALPLTVGWDVAGGLLAHWPLDEGAGERVADVSGQQHHSRGPMRAVWTTGHQGGALRFSGQFGGEWVDLGRQQLGALSGLTVSAWVKLSEPRFGTVFSGGFTIGSGAPTRGIPESERPGAEAFAGVVNFDGWSPKPDGRLDSHRRVDDGQWHHVAWIWSADGWRRIWIDGVEDVARQDAEQAGRRWDDWYWAIGADSDRLVWNFPGTIDEVRIYGRAVSAPELRRLAGVAAEIP